MLQNSLAVFSIDVVRGFIQNCGESGNFRRELLALGNEWDPRNVVLKASHRRGDSPRASKTKLTKNKEEKNNDADETQAGECRPLHNILKQAPATLEKRIESQRYFFAMR